MSDDDERNYVPRSEEAEEAIIGSVLKSPTCIAEVVDLAVQDFYVPMYRAMWSAMRFLWERGLPIDYATLAAHQHDEDGRPTAFTLTDLAGIGVATPSAAHVKHYAEIVRDKATLRRIASIGSDIFQNAIREGAEPSTVVERAVAALEGTRPTAGDGLHSPAEWAQLFMDDIEARRQGRRVAVTSGLFDLDELLGGGLEAGALYLLMGITGLGKTELAFRLALHVAEVHGVVVFGSLEMSAEELAHRAARVLHGMDRLDLAQGRLSEEQVERVVAVGNELSVGRLWPVAPTKSYTVSHLRAHAMRVQAATGRVRLIVLDYVQRLGDTAGSRANREQDVALMAERLKSLAREMHCPVLALVQPNRDYATRPDKRPRLSDLRESGRLEIEADVVLGLHREEMFDPDTERRGRADVYLLKNRSGIGGALGMRATLKWNGHRYVTDE